MELIKDDIWQGFEVITTLQSFHDNILEPVFFKDEVADEIKEGGLQAQKLLLHSYYEYSFIEIAITQAIFLLDKAISTRWKEIHGQRSKESFEKLIDWFFVNNYFETEDKERIHNMRKLRNRKVHRLDNGIGGVAIIHKVYWIFDLINGLYENPELRKVRMDSYYSLIDQLRQFVTKGVIVSMQGKKYIAFSVSPVFINNKSEPTILHLFVSLIFDPQLQQDGKIHYSSVKLSVSDWRFDGNHFKAIDIADGKPLTISKITDKINREKFDTWQIGFNQLTNGQLLLFEIFEPITKLQTNYLRIFHKEN